jgi:Holliday junction resolvasome RuvABC endonuclease subunit
MSNLFCGIDQSLSSTGIVVLDGDKIVRMSSISFSELENFEHLSMMNDYFDDLWINEGFDSPQFKAIGFEGYAFGAKGNTLSRLIELGTIMRLVAYHRKIPTYIFAPQNLKKFIAGKTFKKDEVRLEVFKRWAFEHKSNDIVDAYAIARYTQAIHSQLNDKKLIFTSYQEQAIASWMKNKDGAWV